MKRIAASLLIVLGLAGNAFAQGAGGNPAAESLFKDGMTLRDQGKYKEAAEKFARSQQLEAGVGTLLNLARCYKELNQNASAWSTFKEAETLAIARKDPRAGTAHDEAVHLEPKLAKMNIVAPKIDGLVVTRGGTKVDPAALNTPIPIDAGHFTIEASAPGHKPWKGTSDVADGASVVVTIPALEAAPDAPPPPETSEPSIQRTVGIGLEIGGGAFIVGGLVFGALALSSWSAVDKVCPSGTCPTSKKRDLEQADHDNARTFSTVSTIGIIVGATALAGGVVLHLTAPKNTQVGLSPLLGPNVAGLSLTLR